VALLLVDECLRCGSRMGVGGHPACRGLDRVQNRQQVPSVGTHRSVATPALLLCPSCAWPVAVAGVAPHGCGVTGLGAELSLSSLEFGPIGGKIFFTGAHYVTKNMSVRVLSGVGRAVCYASSRPPRAGDGCRCHAAIGVSVVDG